MVEQTQAKVVVSTAAKSRWPWLIVVIVLAAGLVMAGVAAWNKFKPNTAAQNQVAIARAQSQADQGHLSSAVNILQQAINNTTNATQKQQLLNQEGIVYTNANVPSKALAIYQQAAQFGLTYDLAMQIAQAAQTAGNKQLAITYYKKAISLLPFSNSLTPGDDKRGIEQIIISLGGQP